MCGYVDDVSLWKECKLEVVHAKAFGSCSVLKVKGAVLGSSECLC